MSNRIERMLPQGGTDVDPAQTPGISPQTEQQLREAGDAAARGLSSGAFWAFIGRVLGLGAAAFGGWTGTASLRRYDHPVASTADPARTAD